MKMQKSGWPGYWVLCALVLTGLGAATGDLGVAQAVKNRDQAAVKALLQQRADVNRPFADGSTALHWAAHWNDLSTVELLVRAGADVNASNRFGATPLWMACSVGNGGIVQALVQAGANPKVPALGGEPVLMTAARAGSVEAVKALLAGGADVNAKESRQGQTALMWAVGGRDSHPDVVGVLIERGADVNARSSGGLTPLLFAVREGDLESTRLLVKAGANLNDRAILPGGKTMAVFGDTHWSFPSADTSSALTMAISNGHYDVAMFLLDSGADPNVAAEAYPYRNRPNHSIRGETLKPGLTALHAVVVRRAQSGAGDDERSLALMKAMIAHGVDLNARTPSVRAPKITQLNPQPAITWVEAGGVTPFWIAANALDVDAMRLLVANGADPRIASMENTTPLMVAAGLGIKTRGPSFNLGRRGSADVEVDVLTMLLDWGIDVNAVNEHGQTALHGAAFAAAHAAVQFLVDRGARTDIRDSLDRRPLEVANDNTRVEYRPALQNHDPANVQKTIALLEKLTADGVTAGK